MSEVKKGKAAHVYGVNIPKLREAIDLVLQDKDVLSPNIRGSIEYLKKVLDREESMRKSKVCKLMQFT